MSSNNPVGYLSSLSLSLFVSVSLLASTVCPLNSFFHKLPRFCLSLLAPCLFFSHPEWLEARGVSVHAIPAFTMEPFLVNCLMPWEEIKVWNRFYLPGDDLMAGHIQNILSSLRFLLAGSKHEANISISSCSSSSSHVKSPLKSALAQIMPGIRMQPAILSEQCLCIGLM